MKNMKTAAEYITEEIKKNAEEYYGGELQDAEYEFRESGEPSGLSRGMFSRHYECEEVAKVLDNGVAVGWTYWYGGGKHGEPEAIDWIDESYLLDVTQETKVVNVYKFKQQ